MAEFVRTVAGDKTIYTNKTTNRQVPAEDLKPALKEELDLADAGTVIDEATIEKIDGDGVTDKDGNPVKTDAVKTAEQAAADKKLEDEARDKAAKAAAKAPKKPRAKAQKPADDEEEDDEEEEPERENSNPYRRAVPQTEKGFGFPRANGKTGDIFDVNVPHSHLRTVAGPAVPVSEENYRTKTDAEIFDRLEELELV